MKRYLFSLYIVFVLLFPAFSYDSSSPDMQFSFQFTKSGENIVDFCTYDSASQLDISPLEEDLTFGVLEEDANFPLTETFGVYWDYFADADPLKPYLTLEFSSSRTDTTESCMMINPEGGGLNYSIKADVFNREEEISLENSSSEITILDSEIFSTTLSPDKRKIVLYAPEEGLAAFTGVRQGAQITLSLAPPKTADGSYSEFVGASDSYEGYVILRMVNL